MRVRRSMLPALVLAGIAALLAPRPATADEITLNIPVRLTNMASDVTRGRVLCTLAFNWISQVNGRDESRPFSGGQFSAEFPIDAAAGAYSGTTGVPLHCLAAPGMDRHRADHPGPGRGREPAASLHLSGAGRDRQQRLASAAERQRPGAGDRHDYAGAGVGGHARGGDGFAERHAAAQPPTPRIR